MPELDAKLQVKPGQRIAITGPGPDLAIAAPRLSMGQNSSPMAHSSAATARASRRVRSGRWASRQMCAKPTSSSTAPNRCIQAMRAAVLAAC